LAKLLLVGLRNKKIAMITYPPIKFECQVNGKQLLAEVETKAHEGGKFEFSTKFSDGFSDTVFHDEKSGTWKTGRDKKATYFKKIKDDLSALVSYPAFKHYLSFRHKVGNQLVNIWVFETEMENRNVVYTIYYHGNYQFEMKKIRGGWHAKTVKQNQPELIDGELVDKIGKMIDERIKH
jgi:hypothetical protein